METYRFDRNQMRTINLDENNELTDPEFISRLQELLAAAEAANIGSDNKDSSSPDHIINTRLAINRRPGLLRLKKSD